MGVECWVEYDIFYRFIGIFIDGDGDGHGVCCREGNMMAIDEHEEL